MTRADDAAFKALLEQRAPLTGKVFNTVVPDGVAVPYVVFFPGLSPDYSDRVTAPEMSRSPSYTVHAVGSTAEQAQLVNEWVDGQLRPGGRGVVPVVPGRRNGAVRRDVNAGTNIDTDVSPAYVYAVSEYSWGSDPA